MLGALYIIAAHFAALGVWPRFWPISYRPCLMGLSQMAGPDPPGPHVNTEHIAPYRMAEAHGTGKGE